MKYECCGYRHVFDGMDIKDDYDNGITEGFLCPKCGLNIKDDLGGETVFGRDAKGRYIYFITIVLAYFVCDSLNIEDWIFYALSFTVISAIYIFINKDLISKSKVLVTQRVKA